MRLLPRGPDAVSPTAHYTGAVWAHHGLSVPGLVTPEGRLMHAAGRPLTVASRLAGLGALDDMLLARHREIDRRLGALIAAGTVGQVVEIAAGLSPRGLRLTHDHPALTYVEADLPGMAARKRRVVARLATDSERIRVVDLDALVEGGEGSLEQLFAGLNPRVGTAVVTEGLLMYLGRDDVEDLWRRIAAGLRAFPAGSYLSDLHLRDENSHPLLTAGRTVLGWGVRGRVEFAFRDHGDALAALGRAGFDESALHPAPSPTRAMSVRVIEARTS